MVWIGKDLEEHLIANLLCHGEEMGSSKRFILVFPLSNYISQN